jgi:hypothetical protein
LAARRRIHRTIVPQASASRPASLVS